MTDWCLNSVQMKGIGRKKLYTKSKHGTMFDFGKVLPVPKKLRPEYDSETTESGLSFLTEKNTLKINDLSPEKRNLLKYPLIGPFFDDWANVSQKKLDELYEKGSFFAKNCLRFGAPTRYEWRCRYWGTKSQANNTRIQSDDEISFLTAWCPPVPIFIELSKESPVFLIWAEKTDSGAMLFKDGKIVCDYEFTLEPDESGVYVIPDMAQKEINKITKIYKGESV